jgi:hypothetical protein
MRNLELVFYIHDILNPSNSNVNLKLVDTTGRISLINKTSSAHESVYCITVQYQILPPWAFQAWNNTF